MGWSEARPAPALSLHIEEEDGLPIAQSPEDVNLKSSTSDPFELD